jgi:hypothetical protein
MKRFMIRLRGPVLFALLAAIAACGRNQGSQSGSGYATRASTGDIAFEVTPRGMVDGRFVIDIRANTHSGNLADLDLTKVLTLVVAGNQIQPVQADRLAGHHASSAVVFQVDSAPAQFELVVSGARALPDQRFQWP